jgi:hypothetical protein
MIDELKEHDLLRERLQTSDRRQANHQRAGVVS